MNIVGVNVYIVGVRNDIVGGEKLKVGMNINIVEEIINIVGVDINIVDVGCLVMCALYEIGLLGLVGQNNNKILLRLHFATD